MSKLKDTVVSKVKGLVFEVTNHWKYPKKGEYVPYKEVLNFSIGHFGRELLMNPNSIFGLLLTNMFLAFAVGIRPLHLVGLGTIQGFIGIVFPIIRAKMVDNTRTKWGRFRPYIAVCGFLVFGLAMLLAWLPYETMQYTEKLIWIFVIHIAHAFIAPLYFDTMHELITVISPNSNERAKIISVAGILYSLAPTITSSLFPILAGLALFNHTGYMVLDFYRFVIVPIGALGLIFNMFAVFGAKERLVTEKKYVPRVPTFYGMALIFKNKYWWINRLSTVLGITGSWGIASFVWLFMFRYENLTLLGIFQLPLGTAALVAMIIAPILIFKFNSVRVQIFRGLILGTLWFVAWIASPNMYVFFIVFFLITLCNEAIKVIAAVLNSNIKDYTQYQTGKRMDFTFRAADLVMFPLDTAMAFVLPLFMEFFGFTGDANILFNPNIHQPFFMWIFILTGIGAILGVALWILYFDLNETKHGQVIAALKYRACMRDLKDGVLSASQIKETVELVRDAEDKSTWELPDLQKYSKAYWLRFGRSVAVIGLVLVFFASKNFWAEFKAYNFKQTTKARKKLSKMKRKHDEITSAKLLIGEKNKFDLPFEMLKVELAEKLVGKKIEDLAVLDPTFREYALAMPNTTVEEKKFRLYAVRFAAKAEKMSRKVRKRFPEGLTQEFDMTELLAASEKKVALANERVEILSVKYKKGTPEKLEQTKKIEAIHKEFMKAKHIMTAEEKLLMQYNIALWHYNNAKDLLKEKESFTHYHKVEEKYDEAVKEVEAEEAAQKEKREKEKQEKADEKAKIIAEREEAKKVRKEGKDSANGKGNGKDKE